MTSDVTVADWIKKIAEDERHRDAVRAGETQTATRKAELVRVHGRRLIDDLRAAVSRDVQAFRGEFAGDLARQVVCEDVEPHGGFVVRRPESPSVSLTVAPSPGSAVVGCDYRFHAPNGLPPRQVHLDLVFSGDERETLKFKHHSTAQVFATANALSEYLLVPVFTGRPQNDGVRPRSSSPIATGDGQS